MRQVDLKHEGESDEVIYQYTGEGSPTPNKYVTDPLDEIYLPAMRLAPRAVPSRDLSRA